MSSPCCPTNIPCPRPEEPRFAYFYGRDGYEDVSQDQCCPVETPRSQCCTGTPAAQLSSPAIGRPLCNTCGDSNSQYRQCGACTDVASAPFTSYGQSAGYGQSGYGQSGGYGQCCGNTTAKDIVANASMYGQCCGSGTGGGSDALPSMYGQCSADSTYGQCSASGSDSTAYGQCSGGGDATNYSQCGMGGDAYGQCTADSGSTAYGQCAASVDDAQSTYGQCGCSQGPNGINQDIYQTGGCSGCMGGAGSSVGGSDLVYHQSSFGGMNILWVILAVIGIAFIVWLAYSIYKNGTKRTVNIVVDSLPLPS